MLHHAPTRIEAPCVLVTAHPDDETIGFSANLGWLGAACTVVTVTDGAPRDGVHAQELGFASAENYARARRAELLSAVSCAGIPADQCLSLDVPDQESLDNLVPITLALLGILAERSPRSVVTHAYEGGHPDHDTVAAAVHFAVTLLRESGSPAPELYEFAGYNLYRGWKRYLRFVPDATGFASARTVVLDEAQRAQKRRMFACHSSQQRVLRSFSISVERHRRSLGYDFLLPPHSGLLLYERNGIGPSGQAWRRTVQSARKHLFARS